MKHVVVECRIEERYCAQNLQRRSSVYGINIAAREGEFEMAMALNSELVSEAIRGVVLFP